MSVEAFFFDWYSMTTLVFTEDNNKGIELWTGMDETYVRVKYLKAQVLEKSMLPNSVPATSSNALQGAGSDLDLEDL